MNKFIEINLSRRSAPQVKGEIAYISIDHITGMLPEKTPMGVTYTQTRVYTSDGKYFLAQQPPEEILQKIKNKCEENKWVSVKDKVPENLSVVLCVNKFGGKWTDQFYNGETTEDTPTHWMILPESPEE